MRRGYLSYVSHGIGVLIATGLTLAALTAISSLFPHISVGKGIQKSFAVHMRKGDAGEMSIGGTAGVSPAMLSPGGRETAEERMALLQAYRELNGDVAALIRIPRTVLNHPVVQTPEQEDYYLRRDLTGQENSHGVPFLSAGSSLERDGGNSVIYGHNIHLSSRDVFCDLAYYEDLTYYQSHPLIETVTEAEVRYWLIFAYFLTDNGDPDPFRYSEITTFADEKCFEEYLAEVERRNWLCVAANVSYGDTLLTLSSCSLELAGSGTGRMVVMAKRLEEGEEFEAVVQSAVMRENPLLPERLQ